MNQLPPTDLAERLFQRLLRLLGDPAPIAVPAIDVMDEQAWGRAYARECQRLGSPLPLSQMLQRGKERWVTAFPDAPERAARRDVEPDFELGGDTVPAAFTTMRMR